MLRIFITFVLFISIYNVRNNLRPRQPFNELTDNMIAAFYFPKLKLYLSTDGTRIRTSHTLRSNEQFKLIKSDNSWCLESNNYKSSFISLDKSACVDENDYSTNCVIVTIKNSCTTDNERFEIIKREEIGKEIFIIKSFQYDLYLSIEKSLVSIEGSGAKSEVNLVPMPNNVNDIIFQLNNGMQGDIM